MLGSLNLSVRDGSKEGWIRELGFLDRPAIKDLCISKILGLCLAATGLSPALLAASITCCHGSTAWEALDAACGVIHACTEPWLGAKRG